MGLSLFCLVALCWFESGCYYGHIWFSALGESMDMEGGSVGGDNVHLGMSLEGVLSCVR